MSDLDLIGGVFAKEPNEKAPDFVKAKMSFKLADLANYMRELKKAEPDIEWLNFDVQVAKSGKWYCKRDTWKPTQQPAPQAATQGKGWDDGLDQDIPF